MNSNIPKIIHLIFLSKTEPLPEVFKSCIEIIKNKCKGWEIRIYNEDEARAIVSAAMPHLMNFYNSLSLNVQKSDFLRIILIYLFGGFYMDMDMLCLKSLDGLERFSIVLAEEKTISEAERISIGLKQRLRIANYMFGSIAGHSFWIHVISDMLLAGGYVETENDVLESTGPGLLTNTFHRIGSKFSELLLLRNIDRACLHPSHNAISCHFGNFAAHLHKGTWRGVALKKKATIVEDIHSKASSDLLQLDFKKDSFNYTFLSDVFIYKTNGVRRNMHLFELYKKLSIHMNAVNSQLIVKDKVILVTSSYPEIEIPISGDNNIYIIFLTGVPLDISIEFIIKIELLYDLVIVPTENVKSILRKKGMRLPIEVIFLGFKRLKRDFASHPDDFVEDKHFNIGVYLSSFENTRNHKLIEYLNNLRNCNFRELRLSIWIDSISKGVDKLCQKLFTDNCHWIEFNSCAKNDWLNKLHYFLSFPKNIDVDLEALTSLYLGTPIIIFGSGVSVPDDVNAYILTSDNFEKLQQSQFERLIKISYANYPFFVNKIVEGSRAIQDKYLIEETSIEIITLIKKFLCRTSSLT